MQHQVNEMKSQGCEAPEVHYNQELRKVRNALGDEKALLLDDLVSHLLHTVNLLAV